MTVHLGNRRPDFRADSSLDAASEHLVDSVLLALGVLHGAATTMGLARHLDVGAPLLDSVLGAMRAMNLVHYEVVRPGQPDGIEWRRSLAGIARAESVSRRLAGRR